MPSLNRDDIVEERPDPNTVETNEDIMLFADTDIGNDESDGMDGNIPSRETG